MDDQKRARIAAPWDPTRFEQPTLQGGTVAVK